MAPSATITEETYTLDTYPHINLNSESHDGKQTSFEAVAAKDMVQEALNTKIAQIDVDTCQPGEEDAFYVADLGVVYRQHLRWKLNLNRVKPFYGTCICQLHFRTVLTYSSCEVQP